MKKLFLLEVPKRVHVCISSKSLNSLFVNCTAEYVNTVCKGSCCFNSKGILNVAIAPREEAYVKTLGGVVENGLLKPSQNEKRCPFQRENGLCKIHKRKPIGCAISPFNVTDHNVVMVRFRNLCMNCHMQGTVPAYKVFRKSLVIMFGKKETIRICEHLDNSDANLDSYMFGDVWEDLMLNRKTRRL